MSSIFSKIIAGEIPSYKIAENDRYFAFLDINPVAKGHVLVVPKKEVDYLFDLDDDYLGEYLPFCRAVAKAIEQEVDCERIGIAVLGLEVPHAHIHLIPINSIHDIDFKKPKLQFSEEEFEDIARNIRKQVKL